MKSWKEFFDAYFECKSSLSKPRIVDLEIEVRSTRTGQNGDWALDVDRLFPGNDKEFELWRVYMGYRTDAKDGIVPILPHENEYRIRHTWVMDKAVRLHDKFLDAIDGAKLR